MIASPDLPGLERIRSLAGKGPFGMGAVLGFQLVEVEEGRALFEGRPEPNVTNIVGTVHGGYALSLLDTAMGFAAQSTTAAGFYCTTLETKANMVRAITGGMRVKATGTILSRGRQIITAEGRIWDLDGRLLAHGTSTLKVIPARPIDR